MSVLKEMRFNVFRLVNFGNIGESTVNAEIFRFLLDALFQNPLSPTAARNCLKEVTKSPEYGEVNVEILCQVLVHMLRIESKLEDILELASALYEIHPNTMASTFAAYLTKENLPGLRAVDYPWKEVVKDYAQNMFLDSMENPNAYVHNERTEYALNKKSSVLLISELLLQNFESMIAYLPTFLNYVVIRLPEQLQENSVSTFLLSNIVEGYVSYLHSSNKMTDPKYEKSRKEAKRILTLLDMPVCMIELQGQTMYVYCFIIL